MPVLVFVPDGVDHQQQVIAFHHTNGLPSLLALLDPILLREGERIGEGPNGGLEADAVLAQIARRLGPLRSAVPSALGSVAALAGGAGSSLGRFILDRKSCAVAFVFAIEPSSRRFVHRCTCAQLQFCRHPIPKGLNLARRLAVRLHFLGGQPLPAGVPVDLETVNDGRGHGNLDRLEHRPGHVFLGAAVRLGHGQHGGRRFAAGAGEAGRPGDCS